MSTQGASLPAGKGIVGNYLESQSNVCLQLVPRRPPKSCEVCFREPAVHRCCRCHRRLRQECTVQAHRPRFCTPMPRQVIVNQVQGGPVGSGMGAWLHATCHLGHTFELSNIVGVA